MKPFQLPLITRGLFLALWAWLAFACQVDTPRLATPTLEASLPGTEPAPTALPTASPTLALADTATPAPERVILLIPNEADPALVQAVQPALDRLSQQQGLSFETAAALTAADLDSRAARIVIVLPPDPGIAALAGSAPETQFLAIGISGLAELPNLSVIGPSGLQPDQQGFIAGVIAAMTTPDWRVGVLADASPQGLAAATGFVNGTVYFCGLCRPVYPPYYDLQNSLIDYPLNATIPPGASQAEIQAVAEQLLGQAVKTVYVTPGAAQETALAVLANAGVNLIAGGPLPEELSGHLMVTIQADPVAAVESIWPDLLSGRGGARLPLPLAFSNPNEMIFTPGKQAEARQVLSDLLDGLIGTGG